MQFQLTAWVLVEGWSVVFNSSDLYCLSLSEMQNTQNDVFYRHRLGVVLTVVTEIQNRLQNVTLASSLTTGLVRQKDWYY